MSLLCVWSDDSYTRERRENKPRGIVGPLEGTPLEDLNDIGGRGCAALDAGLASSPEATPVNSHRWEDTMLRLARVVTASSARLIVSRGVTALFVLIVALGAGSPSAQAAVCSIKNIAETIKQVEAERKDGIEQLLALENEVLRLQAALHEKMEEDEGILQDVRGLFGDRPSYAETEQLKQVAAQIVKLQEYLMALADETRRLKQEIPVCEKLLEKAAEKARLQALDNLTVARPGKKATRNVPTFDLKSMASSSGEDDTSVSFGPGIGLGDGGTP